MRPSPSRSGQPLNSFRLNLSDSRPRSLVYRHDPYQGIRENSQRPATSRHLSQFVGYVVVIAVFRFAVRDGDFEQYMEIRFANGFLPKLLKMVPEPKMTRPKRSEMRSETAERVVRVGQVHAKPFQFVARSERVIVPYAAFVRVAGTRRQTDERRKVQVQTFPDVPIHLKADGRGQAHAVGAFVGRIGKVNSRYCRTTGGRRCCQTTKWEGLAHRP